MISNEISVIRLENITHYKASNTEDTKRLGFNFRQKQKTLPIMYWIPEIHKDVSGLNNINEKSKSNLLQYMAS